MNYKRRQALSIGLGISSAIGTVVSMILAIQETPKALAKIKEIKEKDNPKKIDYVKGLFPIYWPSFTVCAATVLSTTMSQLISLKTEASLIATTAMINQGWKKYQGKVKDLFGIDVDKFITTEISKDDYKDIKKEMKDLKLTIGESLYWEENLGFFKCKQANLIAAMADINQRLHTPDPDPNGTFYFATLYFFAQDAEAKVYDKDKLEACKEIGWTTDYLCAVYDLSCMWVHPTYTHIIDKETGEVLYTKIDFFEEPIWLHPSETSRYNYKSRQDYKHELEYDIHDDDAFNMYMNSSYRDLDDADVYSNKVHNIQESFINSKIDCDSEEDNGRRFIPTNPSFTSTIKYVDQSMEKDIPGLPPLDEIPKN